MVQFFSDTNSTTLLCVKSLSTKEKQNRFSQTTFS